MAKKSEPQRSLDEIAQTQVPGEQKLKQIAQRLAQGERYPVTVRNLLSWFNAQRRGIYRVWTIRQALDESSLTTVPDFETAYIDGVISLERISPGEDEASVHTSDEVAGPENQSTIDPIFRLRMLPSANRAPTCINPDATISEATTIMLANDFSQLPVVTSANSVKGMFSWTSYGARKSLNSDVAKVGECMDKAHILSDDTSLFESISQIALHQCVLVKNGENSICGIVSTSDVSILFGQLSEPFLLLSEIENQIRVILSQRGLFTGEELKKLCEGSAVGKEIRTVSDLNFGDYVRILENPNAFDRLDLRIHRKQFVQGLGEIRRIRNEVMHFSPDPPDPADLTKLRNFTAFLQRLQLALPKVQHV